MKIKNINEYKCSRCYNINLKIVEIGSSELIKCLNCNTLYDLNGKSIDYLEKREIR